MPKQPHDPVEQFTHVAMRGVAPVLIMTNPKSGPATLKDLPKAAAAPRYNFASSGPGSIGRIVGEMAKGAMKSQMTHVPYRGGAPMATDLIAGDNPLGINVITAFVPMVKAGQIKALAVTTRNRSPLPPDVPTVLALGLPQLEAKNYFGGSGPAGRLKDGTDKLARALTKIVADSTVVKRFEALRVSPVTLGPAEFTRFVAGQVHDWAPAAIQAADVKPCAARARSSADIRVLSRLNVHTIAYIKSTSPRRLAVHPFRSACLVATFASHRARCGEKVVIPHGITFSPLER